MAIEILLPKLGLTMEEGTVDEWLVDDGAVISMGMPLLRLATDKIDVDVEAEGEGILARAVPDGTTLEPGSVLGWLLEAGEAPPAGRTLPAAAPAAAAAETAGNACFDSPTPAPAYATWSHGACGVVSSNARRRPR